MHFLSSGANYIKIFYNFMTIYKFILKHEKPFVKEELCLKLTKLNNKKFSNYFCLKVQNVDTHKLLKF